MSSDSATTPELENVYTTLKLYDDLRSVSPNASDAPQHFVPQFDNFASQGINNHGISLQNFNLLQPSSPNNRDGNNNWNLLDSTKSESNPFAWGGSSSSPRVFSKDWPTTPGSSSNAGNSNGNTGNNRKMTMINENDHLNDVFHKLTVNTNNSTNSGNNHFHAPSPSAMRANTGIAAYETVNTPKYDNFFPGLSPLSTTSRPANGNNNNESNHWKSPHNGGYVDSDNHTIYATGGGNSSNHGEHSGNNSNSGAHHHHHHHHHHHVVTPSNSNSNNANNNNFGFYNSAPNMLMNTSNDMSSSHHMMGNYHFSNNHNDAYASLISPKNSGNGGDGASGNNGMDVFISPSPTVMMHMNSQTPTYYNGANKSNGGSNVNGGGLNINTNLPSNNGMSIVVPSPANSKHMMHSHMMVSTPSNGNSGNNLLNSDDQYNMNNNQSLHLDILSGRSFSPSTITNLDIHELLSSYVLPTLCCTQHGARYIQNELESTHDCALKQSIFQQLLPYLFRLSTHPFANYVIQKLVDTLPSLAASHYKNVVPLPPPSPLCTPVENWSNELQDLYDDEQERVSSLPAPRGETIGANAPHNAWLGLSTKIRPPPLPAAPEINPIYYCLLLLRAFNFGAGLYSLCIDPFGCRVVQRILDVCSGPIVSNSSPHLIEAQTILLRHIGPHFFSFSVHQHANHVIQKCIENIPMFLTHPSLQPLFDITNVTNDSNKHNTLSLISLSSHTYGCRVTQRVYTHCNDEQRRSMLTQIKSHFDLLAKDLFGNYVIQHVISHGTSLDSASMVRLLRGHVGEYSMHKCASNVVEKAFKRGDSTVCEALIDELLMVDENGDTTLQKMVVHEFANYVVQKILQILEVGGPSRQLDLIYECIKKMTPVLRKSDYSKRILSKLEKKTSHGRGKNGGNGGNNGGNGNHHGGGKKDRN